MLPTPDTSHLTSKDYDNIYEPAEDSFALLDALEKDIDLHSESQGKAILEIGSGTGIISTFLAKHYPNSFVISTDINQAACIATNVTSRTSRNKHTSVLDVVRTSLGDAVRGTWDIIVFNPPYVPTTQSEIDTSGSISSAWAGGVDGMDVTRVLLGRIATMLTSDGVFYLVTVAGNKPNEIQSNAGAWVLSCEILLERSAGREKLTILRFSRIAGQ